MKCLLCEIVLIWGDLDEINFNSAGVNDDFSAILLNLFVFRITIASKVIFRFFNYEGRFLKFEHNAFGILLLLNNVQSGNGLK
jgi:hypothetical protein